MCSEKNEFCEINRTLHIKKLFDKLDFNKDGKICLNDLRSFANKSDILHNTHESEFAEDFLARCGLSSDEFLDFERFSKQVRELDKTLLIIFNEVDVNNDGRICTSDVIKAFNKLGIPINRSEAKHLIKKLDHDEDRYIDYNEWREFLIFHSSYELSSIFSKWHHEILVDLGLDASSIPEDYSLRGNNSVNQVLLLIAGAIAGAVSRTCTAPIDRLKLMRQVHGYKHKGSSFIEAYKYMLNEGGFSSLFRGNAINVLKIAPETSLKYGSYEHYKRFLMEMSWIPDRVQSNPLLTKFIAGSMAGSTAQTIIYPLEVLKTRMCLRKTGQYRSVWHCAATIYEEYGFRGFFRGFGMNLCGIIPYAGIELALYERCKSAYISNFMKRNTEDEGDVDGDEQIIKRSKVTKTANPYDQTPPTYVIPVLAGFSSACGIAATYPISLIRSKLQASTYTRSTHTKVTALLLFKTIWNTDGLSGLYRGMGTNLTKVLPAVGISLAIYETLRTKFNLGPMGSG